MRNLGQQLFRLRSSDSGNVSYRAVAAPTTASSINGDGFFERQWWRSNAEDGGDGIGTSGGDSFVVQHHCRGSSFNHYPPSIPASKSTAETLKRRRGGNGEVRRFCYDTAAQ
ncbi:hypothetical protein PIB30_029923 [Stylosanthes scabra]|uniref:Uncharacterized protein n=1 Tax=Stylosanthes scabra TaxID=79078 RepID=A0ABU6TBN8_9FABA|nr:hypothetical protein [Stylosanthes scabra]